MNARTTGLPALPAVEIAFFETLFGLIFVIPFICLTESHPLKTHTPFLTILRAGAASLALVLWFMSLSKMPLLQVVALRYCGPLLTILGAKIFLGEKCSWPRAFAIGIALFGALLVMKPDSLSQEGAWTGMLNSLLPLGSTACYAVSSLLGKKQAKRDRPLTISFYLLLLSLPLLGSVAAFQWVTPLAWQWPYLLIMGALLAGTYIFLQYAYGVADVTYLIPVSFTRLVAGALIGIVFFQEWPALWVVVGSFIILLASIGLCHYELGGKKALSSCGGIR